MTPFGVNKQTNEYHLEEFIANGRCNSLTLELPNHHNSNDGTPRQEWVNGFLLYFFFHTI